MLIIITIAAAAVAAIAAGGFFAVRAVDTHEERKKAAARRAGESKLSEWEGLAKSHDVSKGYEERFSGSDAWKACKAAENGIRSRLEEILAGTGALPLDARLADSAAFRSFDAARYVKENFDADEIRACLEAVQGVRQLAEEMQGALDEACVLSYDSRDPLEKAKCEELLDATFAMLAPGLKIAYSCPPEDGRRYSSSQVLGENELLGLLGEDAEIEEGTPVTAPEKRRRLMAVDGFRCRRCGRSPLSGGRLRLEWDPYEERFVTLCENCGTERR